jgi:hypothetical protein
MHITRSRVILAATTAVALCVSSSTSTTAPLQNRPSSPRLAAPAAQESVLVDGETSPELVPDDVAFSMFFRSFGDQSTVNGAKRARAYAKHVLRFRCDTCAVSSGLPKSPEDAIRQSQMEVSETSVKALLTLARDVHGKLASLDREVIGIRSAHGGIPNTAQDSARLHALQAAKNAFVNDTISSLEPRLGREATSIVSEYVRTVFKRKMKRIA